MIRRTSVIAATIVSAAMALGVGTQWTPAQAQTATPGDIALAARLAELGRDALRAKTIVDASWRASAAMMQAANRVDPTDGRYPRLLLDADLQLHDHQGAINALKAWLRTNPTNISAQTQLIDLYLAGMESADTKIAYLQEIIGKPPVGDLVRSHAAALATRLLMDRSENDQAAKTLAEALRLNPLNIDALRLRYQMIAVKGTPLERTAALLALLRANPAQPQVMASLAGQVADVGLAQASLEWYLAANSLRTRSGIPATPDLVNGYVTELFIAGQVDAAQKLAGQVVSANPAAIDMWLLKLTMDRATKDASFNDDKKKAGVALSNRLADVRTSAGQKGATTRPVDTGPGLEVPNLTADLAQVKAMVSNEARNAYVSVLADIAWYQMYYLEQPVNPGVLEFLRQTLPADNVTLTRVEGWNALVQGKGDDARVKLSAIADRDPLAKLGVIRLAGKDPKAQDAATADARKLVNDNPSGLLGATLWGELNSKSVQIVKSASGQAVEAELAKFPRDLLKILDTPQEFYAIRGEPLQIAHAFGEPLVVRVTIQNLSDYDLTIGPEGVIHSDLWFDARLRGGIDQVVPGVAYDRIADAGVLRSRQSISQVVRIDQGQLGQFLSTNPAISVQVATGVMTNPQPAQNGLMAGPAGYRVQFPRLMERVATSIAGDAQRQKLYAAITTGDGAGKICAMEVLATYVHLIRTNKDVTKEAMAVTDEMVNAIRTGLSDSEPSVQAWAAYMSALVGPNDQLPTALGRMLTDKSWQKRLLAVSALPILSPEQRKMLPEKAGIDDSDEIVKSYAKAQADLQAIATTQPSVQPGAIPVPGAATKP